MSHDMFTYPFTGISDRARSRLSRSASQSSNDSPQHEPKPPQSNSTNSIPANKPPVQQPKQEVPTANFFETLDWAGDEGTSGESEQPPVKAPEESSFSLLENTSDDEDDFAALRGPSPATVGQKPRQEDNVDLFNVQSNEQTNQSAGFTANFGDSNTQPGGDADFFNMNSTDQLSDGVDLMNVGMVSSNLDLLSGEGDADADFDMFGGDSGNKNSANTFDPFQSFGENKQKPAPPVTVTKPKNDFNTFDPFDNFNGSNSNDTANLGNDKPQATDSGADLMGDWNSFVTNANSSPNLSRNSSNSNLLGADVGGMSNSNSGSFQQMGGGANIPRNNSGSFQPMGGMSRDNSGTFQQPIGQTQQAFGPKGSAAKPADLFAEFGKVFFCGKKYLMKCV